jgi:hypothetical protein
MALSGGEQGGSRLRLWYYHIGNYGKRCYRCKLSGGQDVRDPTRIRDKEVVQQLIARLRRSICQDAQHVASSFETAAAPAEAGVIQLYNVVAPAKAGPQGLPPA